jgi:hypothetical protein
MKHVLLIAAAGLAAAACTSSEHGPADNRSYEGAGMFATKRLDHSGSASLEGMMVSADGRVGRNLTLAGANVRSSADVGGDLEMAGANLRFTGSVGGRSEIAGASIRLNADFTGPVEIAGANIRLDGTVENTLNVDMARLEIVGEVLGPVDIRGHDDRRGGRVIIRGRLAEGGFICAGRVDIRDSARLEGEFRIISDDEPRNMPASGAYEDRRGRECEEI